VTGYRVWKIEYDKVVIREEAKRQLLDDISSLRETLVRYRIEMQEDVRTGQFNKKVWEDKFDQVQNEIASKIEQLSSKAEAHIYRKRGNIPRVINQNTGNNEWPVLIDTCAYDLDYLKTFIHDYSRGRERKP
jgi:hypothetical protein